MWFYNLASSAMDLVSSFVARRSVLGLDNVPQEGPLVVVSNHLSLIDPPFLGAIFPRPVRFMAKEELFRMPGMSWVVRNYRAFPVRRGEADRQALQTSLRLLRDGEVVAIFPEGTRSKAGAMQQAHAGAALIALRAGAPVLPVGIACTERVLCWPPREIRPSIVVRIGEPIHVSRGGRGISRDLLEETTTSIMRSVAQLLPPHYRGVYADATTISHTMNDAPLDAAGEQWKSD
jgi:1-acyl-sn-glycerol-3-phosphate acyltransferase